MLPVRYQAITRINADLLRFEPKGTKFSGILINYQLRTYVSVKYTIFASDDGAKPLSETMLPYCQLDPKEHISGKFN